MPTAKETADELRPQGRYLRDRIPSVWSAYATLHKEAMAPGALDTKTKELIALAVSVARQCDGCIGAHARGAARQGATEAEVAEALGVAVLLNGGPGTVYGPRAMAAFRELGGAPAGPTEPTGARPPDADRSNVR